MDAAVEAARRGRQSAWRIMSRGSELKRRWRRLMGRQRWGRRGGHDGCSGRESGEGRDGTVARKEEKQQSTTGCGNAGGIPTFTLAAAIIFTICKIIVTACAIASSCASTAASAPGATSPSPPWWIRHHRHDRRGMRHGARVPPQHLSGGRESKKIHNNNGRRGGGRHGSSGGRSGGGLKGGGKEDA